MFVFDSEVADVMREAHIMHCLTDCPYIVHFLGLCVESGYYAIVMEYVEHGDLENMLLFGVNDHPTIKQWSCRVCMALDIAKGMQHLHNLEPPIIHRDLKTANLLVGQNYCCKVRCKTGIFYNISNLMFKTPYRLVILD